MKQQGKRFNKGKTRFHLVPHTAHEGVAKVFTHGGEVYGDWNWQEGLPWMEVVSSLERHLKKFKAGEDFDIKSGLPTIDHVTANAMILSDYYKSNPQFDDRPHSYLSNKKIGLDVDGVLANFWKGCLLLKGETEFPEADHWNFPYSYNDLWKKIIKDPDFWLSLEPMADPYLPFEPDCYITHRQVDSSVTAEWLEKNGFPAAKVITVHGSKVDAVNKRGLDIFVDDKFENFVDINKNANLCCCYLMSRKYNERYNVGYRRIHNLKQLV